MPSKIYFGHSPSHSGSGRTLVTVFDGEKSGPLPLRLDLFNHSPTGFGWGGYGGTDRLNSG